MNKRTPSGFMILLGCLGFSVLSIVVLSLFANYVIEKMDITLIAGALAVLFVTLLFFEWRKIEIQKKKDAQFISVAKFIRPAFQNEIESFFKAAKRKSKPLDLFSNFMEDKKQVLNIDWRGEENEGEIEAFVQTLNHEQIGWTKVKECRISRQHRKDSDDKFTINLLKSIDKDLQSINARLLFLKTDGDNYLLTSVDADTYKTIIHKLKTDFYGVDKL